MGRCVPTRSTMAWATISHLQKFFVNFGTAKTIIGDNGPQFRSKEFKDFCRVEGIRQVFSAPFHPASNGQAERMVQTVKKTLLAAQFEGKTVERGLQDFLVAYRKSSGRNTGLTRHALPGKGYPIPNRLKPRKS